MPTDTPPAMQAVTTALYWLYDRIAGPTSGTAPPAVPLSDRDIDRMIRRTAAQAGTVGFATNLGGLLTLPIALPANLAAVGALQVKLIQDIARARGYDLGSEQVRNLTVACVAGSTVLDTVKDLGVSVGMRASQRGLLRIGGAMTAARIIPFIGGAISGTVDGLATAAAGAAAKRVFVRRADPIDPPTLLPAPVIS